MPKQESWKCGNLAVDPMQHILSCMAQSPVCRIEAALGHLDMWLRVRHSIRPHEDPTSEIAIVIKAKGYGAVRVVGKSMRIRFDRGLVMTQPFVHLLRDGEDLLIFHYDHKFRPTPLDRIRTSEHSLCTEIDLKHPRLGLTVVDFSLTKAREAIRHARSKFQILAESWWDVWQFGDNSRSSPN